MNTPPPRPPTLTDSPGMDAAARSVPADHRNLPRRRRHALPKLAAGSVWVYVVAAYLLAPLLWEVYLARNPSLRDLPGVTHTRAGIPGDPLNVALVGTEQEVQNVMRAANWIAARPLGLRSDLKLAEATILRRADQDAPVSHLYLFGRPEDLAFEQPVGHDPRQRHHVRFWRTDRIADDGRPIWVGSATFDRAVGLSHTTGEITHHIDGDIDAERDHLLRTLQQSGLLASSDIEPGFHQTLSGRNGGGDHWRTDGDLRVGVIALGATDHAMQGPTPAQPSPESR